MTESETPPGGEHARGAREAGASLWLIDGFNVLHAGGLRHQRGVPPGPQADGDPSDERSDEVGWWTAPQRRKVIDRAERFDDPRAALWVVFDGSRPPDRDGGPDEPEQAHEEPVSLRDADGPEVHVLFAPSADEWIRRRVRDAQETESIRVVTADRQLADRARHHGAQVFTPRQFLARCGG